MADDPDQSTLPDRVSAFAGRVIAEHAPFGADYGQLQEGFEQLAPDASEEEVFEALDTGILAGMSWTEKRRALRDYHDQATQAGVLQAAVDVTRVENDDQELTALRVLCSAPEAKAYRGDGEVLIHVDEVPGEPHRLEVPWDDFQVAHQDTDGVAEFEVRPREPVPDETGGEGGEPPDDAESEFNFVGDREDGDE